MLPPSLRHLYVAADNDAAGHRAAMRLIARAREAAIDADLLLPRGDDWNTHLRAHGPLNLLVEAAAQFTLEDARRFTPAHVLRAETRP